MENEQKKVGASYIFNFYNDVQALTNYYAEYRNIINGFRKRYPAFSTTSTADDDDKSLSDQDQSTALTSGYNIVFFSHKAYIEYKTIIPLLKGETPEVTAYYDKIKNEVLPNCDDIEAFVVSLNRVIFSKIVQDVLTSNQDLINEIYGGGAAQNDRKATDTDINRG